MSSDCFGQLVLGPPGSGKTTYCAGMYDLLTSLGRRVSVINLDPAANPALPYPCAIDIRDLVTLADVVDAFGLGPNGGLVYCMEVLQKNLPWLRRRMAELPVDAYVLWDFPGQVELYTLGAALDGLFDWLRRLSPHLTAVHLVDAFHVHNASTYLSSLLLSLCSMTRLEMPHVNVLSKVDLLRSMGGLRMPLSFYTEAMNLQHLVGAIEEQVCGRARRGAQEQREEATDEGGEVGDEEDEEEIVEFETGEDDLHDEDEVDEDDDSVPPLSPAQRRYLRLTRSLCELVESYNLVSFHTLSITDKASALRLLQVIDTSNGYAFTNTAKEYAERGQHAQAGSHANSASDHNGGYSMFNVVNTQDTQPPHDLEQQLRIRERPARHDSG